MDQDLIRPEVLEARRADLNGTVLLVHPLSHRLLAAAAIVLFGAIAWVLAGVEYTRRTTIPGVVEPSAGLAKVYAPQPGVVVDALVREGDVVRAGGVLLRVDAQRRDGQGVDVQARLGSQARERLAAMRQELASTLRLQDAEAASTQETLDTLAAGKANLQAQVETQRAKIAVARDALAQGERLRGEGFISNAQLEQLQASVMDQQMKLDEVQKAIIETDGQIARATRDAEGAPFRRQVARAQAARNIASVESEISQLAGEHSWTVAAPVDGTVAAVHAVAGQAVVGGTPLLTIVPSASKLRVRLYAPSRALGFVHVGAPVRLRLDAFPFQKFGTVLGHVSAIADAPVPPNELVTNTTLLAHGTNTGEPVFAILVDLDRETLQAYGRSERLRPGLQLDADVVLDRRRLVEWLLEPLFAVARR